MTYLRKIIEFRNITETGYFQKYKLTETGYLKYNWF